MKQEAIEIILRSENWEEFNSQLDKYGSATNCKKLKGDAFEFLAKFHFLTSPLYSTLYESVWHHSEVPPEVRGKLKLANPEVGVDLIARDFDGLFCAIQCKYHQDANQNVTYDELATFFSVTERGGTYENLSHRLVCTSANEIAKRIKKIHTEKLGFLCADEFKQLGQDEFARIKQCIVGKPVQLIPYTPRPHQLNAIQKSVFYFENKVHKKGKIIHPCGSGKSLTAYWLAERLGAKSVLIAVPSLALVKQTLGAWCREAVANGKNIDWVAICSDKDVTTSDDASLQTFDLGITVTTNPKKVAEFLDAESNSLKLAITTYQSSQVMLNAVDKNNFVFDLGIFDEAHKTAGHRTKKFSQLLNDDNVKFQKKIFMTATERQFKKDSSDFLSMDNSDIYGEVIDHLSFKKALEQIPPILCDYKVITVAITKREIQEILETNNISKVNGEDFSFETDASTVAGLISLRKLGIERNIRHAISFHSSIRRAEEFRDLNNLINSKRTALGQLNAYHVSGKDTTGRRSVVIDQFLSNSPSVIANARCLTEGVDIPAVDAVIFTDPKQSVIDIVQAAGRAMRIHSNKKIGYIIIPVILDFDLEDTLLDAFKQIITVIAALGISDDRIIEEAKQYVSSLIKSNDMILEFIEFSPISEIQFAKFIDNLQIKIWDRLSFAKSVIGESRFANWMSHHTSLSSKTIKNYNQAVRKISNDLIKLNMAYSSLEDISKKADLKKLKEDYFAIDEFKQLDFRGKGMYSAGFNRLIEYQEFIKAGY